MGVRDYVVVVDLPAYEFFSRSVRGLTAINNVWWTDEQADF